MWNQRCLKTHLSTDPPVIFYAALEACSTPSVKWNSTLFSLSLARFCRSQKHTEYSQLCKCLLMGVSFVVFEGCREVKALENEQLSVFRDFYSTFRASGRARRENPWGCLFGIQSTGSRASSSTHSASTERQLFNPCRVNIHSGACQERREIKRRALHLLFKKGE